MVSAQPKVSQLFEGLEGLWMDVTFTEQVPLHFQSNQAAETFQEL